MPKPYVVMADLVFSTEPLYPERPQGPRKMIIRGLEGYGQSAGYSAFGFDTLEAAEAFASRTTIFGRVKGNRIDGPGSENSPYNKMD